MTLMLRQTNRQTFSSVDGRERKNERSLSRCLDERTSWIAMCMMSSSKRLPKICPLSLSTHTHTNEMSACFNRFSGGRNSRRLAQRTAELDLELVRVPVDAHRERAVPTRVLLFGQRLGPQSVDSLDCSSAIYQRASLWVV